MSERNQDTTVAKRFHNRTKYLIAHNEAGQPAFIMGEPPDSGPGLGEQDRAIEPFPYKIYTSLDPIPLPREPYTTSMDALTALSTSGHIDGPANTPDLRFLAHLCLRSNGVLKRWTAPNGREIEFRAAGCTGARYHLELYLVCGDLDGLDAGIYHYAAHDHSLRQLRSGDYRSALIEATGNEPATSQAPVIAIVTSTFWRNAWRYLERTYRHVFWDAGTLFANLLALSADANVPAKTVLGFVDADVNALLDVDGTREAAVAMLALGSGSAPDETSPAIEPLGLPTQQISPREIDFPEIWAMHRASSFHAPKEVADWRARPLEREPRLSTTPLIPLQPLPASDVPQESIVDVIQKRRSNRHYDADTPFSFEEFSTVLDRSIGNSTLDALAPESPSLFDAYLIVNNVEGLAQGVYVVHPASRSIELLKQGDFRQDAAHLACKQDYAADAHVNVYAMTDLGPVLERYGNRGYRLAQYESGLFGGRFQLAAHAIGLGAVGSTSFDNEVTDFLSPHGAGKSFMFVGVFGRKRRPSAKETEASMSFVKARDPENA